MSNPEILILDDFSAVSDKALEIAGNWAHRLKLHLATLHICNTDDACEPAKENMHLRAAKYAAPGAVKTFARCGNLFREIRNCYIQEHPYMLVFGTHGIHGIRQVLFGAHSMKIIEETSCPALLVQAHTPARFPQRWMVVNNTPWDAHSVNRLSGLLKSTEASAGLIHFSLDSDETSAEEETALNNTEQMLRDAGKQVHTEAVTRQGFGAGFSRQIYEHLGLGGYDLLVLSRQAYPILGKAAYEADCEALINNPAGIPVLFI